MIAVKERQNRTFLCPEGKLLISLCKSSLFLWPQTKISLSSKKMSSKASCKHGCGERPKAEKCQQWVPQGVEQAHLERTDRIYWREGNLPARETDCLLYTA